MKQTRVLLFCGLLIAPYIAGAQAILIEDPRSGVRTTTVETTESPPLISIEKGTLRNFSSDRDYISLFELKAHRRMGIGAEIMGRLGMVGVTFDFNFSDRHAATAGLGAGPQYYSYSLGYKRTLNDTSLSPYLGLSMTRMQLLGESRPKETIPGWANDYFANEPTDRVPQRLLIAPQLGLQYTQFYGPSAGATMFMEVLFLYDYEARKTAPAAAFGMMYYL